MPDELLQRLQRFQTDAFPLQRSHFRHLVDDGQHPQGLPIRGAVEDEVVAPDVVGTLGTASDDRTVGEPEPTTLRLLLWHLQPLLSPEPFDSLVVHPPALLLEQCRDAPVAVASEATGQRHDPAEQRLLVR